MAHQQSLRSMYTPPPLKLDDARVLQARQVVAGCRHTVRKNPVSGYCAGDVNCTGLTRRLASKIMPHLNDTNKAYNAQWFATKRRGGSSTALGKRLDREIHHLVNCIRDPTIDVQRLAAAGSALPGLEKRERDKMPACTFCNLQGQTYGRRTPGWHRWTRAYLSDMHRYGMRLIASQVPVAVPLRKIATEIDDFALDHNGDPVVIERKSGYADATGKPRKKSGNNTITIQVPGQEERPREIVVFQNTQHTLHRLQARLGWEFMKSTIPEYQHRVGRSCVAYVSGKSRAPVSGAGRDLDGCLECVWLWDDASVAQAGRAVVDVI